MKLSQAYISYFHKAVSAMAGIVAWEKARADGERLTEAMCDTLAAYQLLIADKNIGGGGVRWPHAKEIEASRVKLLEKLQEDVKLGLLEPDELD